MTEYDSALSDYTNSGLVKTVTGPKAGDTAGLVYLLSTYAYDLVGNPTALYALGPNSTPTTTVSMTPSTYSQTSFTYATAEAIGQPLTVTTTGNNYSSGTTSTSSSFQYDLQGNVTATIDALGHETDSTYTITNAPLAVALPATGQSGTGRSGTVNTYLYQMPLSVATMLWPVGTLYYGPLSLATSYDEGNVGAIRQVGYTYGAEGELLSTQGSTEPVTYTYDALYRLSTLKDGGGNVTYYFYTTAGYLGQVVYPGAVSAPPTLPLAAGHSDTVSFTSYDLAGNLLTRVDGKATPVTTTYTYSADPESLLTAIGYSDSTPSVSLTYDAYGRRMAMTDGTGSMGYTYDDDDNPLNVATTYTSVPTQTLAYLYNPDGSRRSMGVTGLTTAFSYVYDGLGREVALTNPFGVAGETSNWTYQANGWLATQTLGNNAVTTYTRNALGQTTDQITKTSTGVTRSDFSVPSTNGYDGAGNLLSVTESLPALPAYGGTTNYTYDYAQTANSALNRSQLTKEVSTRTSGYTNTYAYDSSVSGGPGNATGFKTATHTFNANNQLSDTGYTYDGNGNPTTFKAATLTFDAENRMTSYGGTTLTNGYRGDGLRGWKQASGGVKDYFLYDGEQLLGDFNSSGVYTYLYTTGANGLLSRRNVAPAVTTFYTFDLQGNVVQTMLADQSPHTEYWFDGYGGLGSGGPFISPDPYSNFGGQWGYYSDSETGLELLTHRFYDRGAGRFINRDPIGYKGGVDLYAYTANNPVNGSDPDGTSKNLSGMTCPELAAYIAQMENIILAEEQKYLGDGDVGGFRSKYGPTKFAGHWIEIRNAQRALGRALAEYAARCGTHLPVPPVVWKYYPYPSPYPITPDAPLPDITAPLLLPLVMPWGKALDGAGAVCDGLGNWLNGLSGSGIGGLGYGM